MPRTSSRLSRPRSVFFDTVPNSMKRLTAFLGTPDDSANEVDMFGQRPSGDAAGSESLVPPGQGVTAVGTRPHLSISTPSLALTPEDRTYPASAGFPPPIPPFAGGPGSQSPSSPAGSLRRPQSSGGLGVPGTTKSKDYSLPLPEEFPRTKKKRKSGGGLFGKKKNEGTVMAWRYQHGSSENLESYDVGPLLRGEKVCCCLRMLLVGFLMVG